MKKVLLLEPNYKNKYPPMGLMKLAMYHRLQGNWDVVFYKGDLKAFVVSELTQKAIHLLEKYEPEVFWAEVIPDVSAYIKTGKAPEKSFLEYELDNRLFASTILDDFHRDFKKGTYFSDKPWDRVCVTTLFTFYAKITYETIEFAKKIVKDVNQLMVGGIMASVVPDELERRTGIKPFKGCIYDRKIFNDKPIDIPIDALPLDYSILDEIEYKYPETNGYYGYTTRGCVNKCPFCAVPKLEPEYQEYIPLKPRIDFIKENFGEQKDLLLLDNNVFASKQYDRIIDEIRDCGFAVGSKSVATNPLSIVIKQLENGWNDRAYIKKGVQLLNEYVQTLKGEDHDKVYASMLEYNLLHDYTATKEGVLTVSRLVQEQYNKKFKRSHRPVTRYVDFNQGVDARLASEDKIKRLSTVAIRPLRVAFDDWKFREKYTQAIYYANKYNISLASNYILYNFRDEPVDLYNRLLLNVDLSMHLGITIYSFPMKYHPIMEPEWFDNRDYIGEKWCRKAIRTIQVILNATKGKVGVSRSFFFAAFGRDVDSYNELLRMPEEFILNRYDAEAAGLTDRWRDAYSLIKESERIAVDALVNHNVFIQDDWSKFSKNAQKYLKFYLYRKDDIPVHSQDIKNKIRDQYIASCPTDISDTCKELLSSIKK